MHGPRSATALALAALVAIAACGPAVLPDRASVVTGVGPDDMLKLRAGPGTGFDILAGLPEGARVLNDGCQRVGGTPWCKVRLPQARGMQGYVSGHYLTEE